MAEKELKSSSLIKTVKDDLKYESLIKQETSKLKRDEIREFQLDTKTRHQERQQQVIEKQVAMQRQLLRKYSLKHYLLCFLCVIVRKLQTDVRDIKLTEFNKMKKAAQLAQKEEEIQQINAEARVKFATEMKIKQQKQVKKQTKVKP